MFQMREITGCLMGLLLGLSLTACQPGKSSDSSNKDKELNAQQKQDKAEKEKEYKEKNSARFRQVLVEHQALQIVMLNDSTTALRLSMKLNKFVKSTLFKMNVDQADEQMDILDKTDEIRGTLPDHNLEIWSYRFKSGTIPLLALEYRFTRTANNKTESASQFILMTLDKSLGDKAILKTGFEFPVATPIDVWAKKAKSRALETP